MCYRKNKNLPYDVIIGCDLMEELQIDVLYSEDVAVWGGIRPTMYKIQNGKWTDLNLMDQKSIGHQRTIHTAW